MVGAAWLAGLAPLALLVVVAGWSGRLDCLAEHAHGSAEDGHKRVGNLIIYLPLPRHDVHKHTSVQVNS